MLYGLIVEVDEIRLIGGLPRQPDRAMLLYQQVSDIRAHNRLKQSQNIHLTRHIIQPGGDAGKALDMFNQLLKTRDLSRLRNHKNCRNALVPLHTHPILAT